MDHRAFLTTLTAEQRQSLTQKSDVKGLLHLVLHWGAIAFFGWLIFLRVPGWPVLMLPQGILLVFLFTLLHETSHSTPFQTEWLNKWIGRVSGFVIFLPSLWFRYFHFAHHRFTQVPGKDPELESPKPETVRQYLVHMSGIPVWLSHFRTLIRNASAQSNDSFVPQGKRTLIRDEARLLVVVYGVIALTSIALKSSAMLYVWLVPIILGQPFLRLYLLAEHGRCAFVSNMLENSRTTFTNRAVRALAWNMPYHAEHHSFPTVPFHQLPFLHTLISPHLVETENGYARFNVKYAAGLSGPRKKEQDLHPKS